MNWCIFLVVALSMANPAYVERPKEPAAGCDSFKDCWDCLQHAACVFRVPVSRTKDYSYCEAVYPERNEGPYGPTVTVRHPHGCSGIRDDDERQPIDQIVHIRTTAKGGNIETIPTTTKPIEDIGLENGEEGKQATTDLFWAWIVLGVAIGLCAAWQIWKAYRLLKAAKTRWQRGKRAGGKATPKDTEMENMHGRTYTRSFVEDEVNQRWTPSPLTRQDRKYHTICGDRRRNGRDASLEQTQSILRNSNFGVGLDAARIQRQKENDEARIAQSYADIIGQARAVYDATTTTRYPLASSVYPTANPTLVHTPNCGFSVPMSSYCPSNIQANFQSIMPFQDAVKSKATTFTSFQPTVETVTAIPAPPPMNMLNIGAAQLVERREEVLRANNSQEQGKQVGSLLGDLKSQIEKRRKSVRYSSDWGEDV